MHQRVWNIRVLLKNLEVNLNRALAEFLALFGSFVLTDRPNELVCEVYGDLVATNLKKAVHVADIPVLVRCEGVSED